MSQIINGLIFYVKFYLNLNLITVISFRIYSKIF